MNKILILVTILVISGLNIAFADKFVPEFELMKTLKCTINEEIYEKDGSLVSKNTYFRYYKLDDENSKIYLQKAPVEKILFYDDNKIEFRTQHLTDDFIMQSQIVINRLDNTIKSNSTIDYDNSELFPSRTAVGSGSCEELK